jgi:hypothetical protein
LTQNEADTFTTDGQPGRTAMAPAGAWSWLRIGAIAAVALAGWGWGAWEHFVAAPRTQNITRITYTLDLIDRFDDTEAHKAYVQLATDMKPWWDQIEDLQRRIQSTPGDDIREALIAERDASLLAFIESHDLGPKIDLLIGAFDEFVRCLDTTVCDQDVLDKAIGIDVKRIYRTYRPYILARRARGETAYAKDLEDLFFRFLG